MIGARILLVAFAAMFLAGIRADFAHAQARVAGRPLETCVVAVKPGERAQTILAAGVRSGCDVNQTALGPGNFWALSAPVGEPSTVARPLSVRVASLWQRALTLHVRYADGTIRTIHADGRGTTARIQLGAILEFPIPAHAAPVDRLLWRVDGSANLRGVLNGQRIATRDESIRANLSIGALYGAFAGLCIALIAYNLALWAAMRHRFQLVYCAMVACLLAYAATSSGALAWVWPELLNNDRLRINHLLLGLSAASAVLFARSFFEPKVFAGWLSPLTHVIAAVTAGAGIAFFLLAPVAIEVMDRLFSLSFLLMGGLLPAILWRAWRQRSNYLWLFMLAWAAPVAAAVLRAVQNLGFITWNFWLDNSTLIGLSAEALLSSVAIAYRIRMLARERDEAIVRETLARRLADTDPLTGLLNRRAFLEQAIGRSGDQSLLLLDLDHFKRVNETLGHEGGDEVLRVFARTMRGCVPAGALVARMGGEEFAVLSDAAAPVDPDVLLARIRAARMPFDVFVTASIGSCVGPIGSDIEWKRMYRDADRALFDAKAAGRDRVRRAFREAA